MWTLLWLLLYQETNSQDEIPLFVPKVNFSLAFKFIFGYILDTNFMIDRQVAQNRSLRWTEFIAHWPLWALYIAHFAMNWSNYIIMQWLPTYLARNLSANKESISLTALPYIVNSLIGIGRYLIVYFNLILNIFKNIFYFLLQLLVTALTL